MKTWQHLLTAAATILVMSTSPVTVAEEAKEWSGEHGCKHRFGGSRGMHGGMMGNPDIMLKRLTRFLDLTDEQVAQMAQLVGDKEERKAQRDAMRDLHERLRQAAEEGAVESQLQALAEQLGQQFAQQAMTRINMMRQMKAILTPEQLERLGEIKEHWEKEGHKGFRGHGPDLTYIEENPGATGQVLII